MRLCLCSETDISPLWQYGQYSYKINEIMRFYKNVTVISLKPKVFLSLKD